MSKAICMISVALILLGLAVLPAAAAEYQFVPSPADLGDLDHGYYYSWGIAWTVPANERIIEATLFIKSINDWTNEANDHLYIHLLDNPNVGVRQWYDGQGGGDNWAGHPLIADWSDTNTWNEDLTFDFSTIPGMIDNLTAYSANNGVFGLGFDPDCHYYNSGIKLTITTKPEQQIIPEPSSLAALALGMLSLGGLVRRRRSA